LRIESVHVGGGKQRPAVQTALPDTQSAVELQTRPVAHFNAHEPPQSTSDSVPSLTPSVQVGPVRHVKLTHAPLAQSLTSRQRLLSAHFVQRPPPQSTSVSNASRMPLLQSTDDVPHPTVPSTHTLDALQYLPLEAGHVSASDAMTIFVHVPGFVLVRHDWQLPVHAVAQHTPSTHERPSAQVAEVPQVPPEDPLETHVSSSNVVGSPPP